MTYPDARVYTVVYPSGREVQRSIPVELERRSDVIQNALAVGDQDNPRLILPGDGFSLDAWAQVALPGALSMAEFPTEFFLKALMTADFLADQHTVRLAADELAVRLFDVPCGEIAHSIGPKGASLGLVDSGSSYKCARREQSGGDTHSSKTVHNNSKIFRILPPHLTMAVLGSSKTCLKKSIRGLPVSLYPLAVEACFPGIRECKTLNLINHAPPWSSSNKAGVLQAAATFTSIERLRLNSMWIEPFHGSIGNSVQHLLGSLQALQVLHLDSVTCHGAAGIAAVLPHLTRLQELSCLPYKLYLDGVEEFEGLVRAAPHSLRKLRMHHVSMIPDSLRTSQACHVVTFPEGVRSRFSNVVAELSNLEELSLSCACSVRLFCTTSPWGEDRHATAEQVELARALYPLTNLKALQLKPASPELRYWLEPRVLHAIAALQNLTSLMMGSRFKHGSAIINRDVEWIRSTTFVSMIQALVNLQVLDLAGLNLLPEHGGRFAQSLQQLVSLRSLNLANHVADGQKFWQLLAPCLSGLQQLQVLVLSENDLHEQAVADLSRAFCNLRSLQELYLDYCQLRGISKELSDCLGQLSGLQVLSLCGNKFVLTDIRLLALSCGSMHLTSLDLYDVYSCFFTTDAAEILGQCIKYMPSLSRVSLGRKQVWRAHDVFVLLEAAAEQQGVVSWDRPGHLEYLTGY